MNTLNKIHHRALVTASATMSAVLAVVLLYWRGVAKGSLPSPAQPLVQKAEPAVATNPPTAKAVTVAAVTAPAATPSSPSKRAARLEAKNPAQTPAATKPAVTDPASVADHTNIVMRPPQNSAVTNLAATTAGAAAPVPPNISTNFTAEDEHVARLWLEDTNQRPAIRVHYRASDVVRLATELSRGLLVAGSGTTNRREFFLQSTSIKSRLFSPFTKSVAQRFADYSLALNPSTTFDPLTTPLPAYFPDGNYDLAFVPDRVLATDIFAKAASALRALPKELASSKNIVFEGQLRLVGAEPAFVLLEAKQGTNRYAFVATQETEAR